MFHLSQQNVANAHTQKKKKRIIPLPSSKLK